MGNGDNKRTRKMRQRKSWRRLKMRLRKKMEMGRTGASKPTAAKKKAPTAATVTRKPAEAKA